MSARLNSTHSYGFFSVMTDKSLPKVSNNKLCKVITKVIIILLTIGLISYIFLDYDNFNKIFPDTTYQKMLENYDKIYIYSDIINYFTNYHVFLIFFIFGFCLWNIYKSFIHIFGFFVCEFILFILKLIFRKIPKVLTLNIDNINLSNKSLIKICSYTSEYECPSYRAAYVIYSYMSFICLLFKEKKLRNRKISKVCCRVIFAIICILLNSSLLFLMQSTIGSIIIGSGIGFIIYFFMFSLLKIDYDRSEQMVSFLNCNLSFYFLINITFAGIIIVLHFVLDLGGEKDKFAKLCGNTEYNFKELNLETIFKSLFFFCNLTMIICIKLQRRFLFQSDGLFVSRNFNVEEIVESNNLMAQIKGEETLKFNTKHILKYLCKVLICLGIALLMYLIFQIIKYYKSENYVALSVMAYMIPTNLLIIFLFFFSKWLFIHLDLEVYTYSD